MITTLLQFFQVRFSYLLKVTRRDHFITCKIAQNKKKLSTKLRTLPVAIYILHATDKLKKKQKKQKNKRFRVALTKRIILNGYIIKDYFTF